MLQRRDRPSNMAVLEGTCLQVVAQCEGADMRLERRNIDQVGNKEFRNQPKLLSTDWQAEVYFFASASF